MVKKSIRIAVFGCGHGKLDDMYSSLDPSKGVMPPDLVIINGDFQAIRNYSDLNSMSVPQKYRELGDFPKYYSGEKKAPYLTLVIGGNHEASNYMSELSYGGWLAPNIYYLGLSNVIEFGGIRIGGWSGIYNYGSYLKGYMESFPYNSNDIRSIYHTREFQFHKLNHFTSPLDVFISHDWPNGITDYGNVNQLLRFKPFFKDDINRGRLGSPPSMDLLKNLRPKWWFGSHLHCRFTATVNHKPLESEQLGMSANNDDEINLDELDSSANQSKLQVKNDDEIDLDGNDEVTNIPQKASKNEDEIDLDDENDEVINIPQQISNNNEDEIDLEEDITNESRNVKRFKSPIATPKQINTNQTTQFLALDKCLPRRQFMEIVEIPLTDSDTKADQKLQLEYNLEWLAIVKAFNELTPTRPTQSKLRFKEKEIKEQIERNLIALEQATKLGSFDKVIPQNFSQVAPTQADHSSTFNNGPGIVYSNPQTSMYCDKLGILNKFL